MWYANSSELFDLVSALGSPSKLVQLSRWSKGVVDHCPKTHGQALAWLAPRCPQGNHGFTTGAAEQAGSTWRAPPFLNRICIRYPPTLSPRSPCPWSGLFCLERLRELPKVTPSGRG